MVRGTDNHRWQARAFDPTTQLTPMDISFDSINNPSMLKTDQTQIYMWDGHTIISAQL